MPGETTSSVVALSLGQIAESDSQQDPTFKTSLAYTRLTATSALEKLKEQGFSQEQLPCASTMAQVLNRMGYGLPKVVKAKPQKKIPQTDDIFNNIKEFQPQSTNKPQSQTTKHGLQSYG